MNKVVKILSIFIFIYLPRVFAKEVLNEVVSGNQLVVQSIVDEGNLLTSVTYDAKKLRTYLKSEVSERLYRVKTFNQRDITYLVISFYKGVHGEHFEVWRFPEAKSVFEFKSIWPVIIDDSKQKLSIRYFDHAKKNPSGTKKKVDFKY